MKLKFILGRAGTGKTHYILEHIKKTVTLEPEGPPVILLVPEQATFQAEYTLAGKIGGTVRSQVLSFRRLAHRVLLETGGAAKVPIGELGKRMVLRELLERYHTELKLFSKSAGRTGFADTLARIIGEFKTYLITPENLETAVRVVGNSDLLRDKLSDLALLYRELESYLNSRFTDPDDYLNLLAQRLPEANSFKGAEIWIDGFKGFTPQEIRVILSCFKIADNVNIALCIEPGLIEQELDRENVFYPVWDTYRNLINLVKNNGIELEKPVLHGDKTPYRFTNSPDIAHLENCFFTHPAPVSGGQVTGIKLVAGSNRRAEVEACAREILRLVTDRGFRWREIALILRDMEPYHELLASVFSDYGIPFFVDRKRNVMHHPLVELIRSSLEIIEKDWSYQPVFRYLKTDLVPVDREDIYLLENYVLAHGIRGRRWIDGQEWNYVRRYTLGEDQKVSEQETQFLAKINEIRILASNAMIGFCERMSGAETVKQKSLALYSLLEELQTAQTIENWRNEAESGGHLDKAREHAQIWSNVINLLDEIVEAMGDEKLDTETYRAVLDAGFESMTVGLIPPGLDQVVVASLDRSRSPEVRAAFILGANEGILPSRMSAEGIFSDSEREKLESIGLTIAPGGRRKAFEEQFLVYTALTRASELLWLSYPVADDEGRAMNPSPVIDRVRQLLPEVQETSYQVEPLTGENQECDEFIVHPGRALSYLINRLREFMNGASIGNEWWNLYNWFIINRAGEQNRVFNSLFHVNSEDRIGRDKCTTLYGNPVRASISRLEKFKACPFAHFSTYGLKLEDRRIHRLDAPDMGEFFHAALKDFTCRIKESAQDWGALSHDQLLALSDEVVEQLAPKLQSEILLSTARYRYLTGKLKRTVNRAVLTLAEHARRSDFRPVAAELAFGNGGQVPPLKLNLSDGILMELSGRIDRLDAAEKDGHVYLRIIDYKSSEQDIRIQEIYQGLKLQLLAYLNVALQYYTQILGKEAKPAGVLYYAIREPMINVSGPKTMDEAAKLVLNRLKMRGLLLNDREVFRLMDNTTESGWSELFPVALRQDGSFYANAPVIDERQFQLLQKYLNGVFVEVGEEILSGNVEIHPYRDKHTSACKFCGYKPVCKFDNMLKDNVYRAVPQISTADIWDLIAGKGVQPDEQP